MFVPFLTLQLICCKVNIVLGQNHALVLNGAYVKLNNGTFAKPIYLVINNGSDSAIIRNSGHIISEAEGDFVKWMTGNVTTANTFVLPFGYSTTDYIPVNINKTSTGPNNASAITVSTWTTPVANTTWASTVTNMVGLTGDATTSAIDRGWQIMMANNVTGTADLSYRGAENTTSIAPTGSFNGQEWDATSANWLTSTGSGTGVTTGIGTVVSIVLGPYGATTSSPYVLTSATAPLPIELVSFTAKCENNQTNISWVNASETNIQGIELQKSTDLSIWNTIYTAQAANSTTINSYDYNYIETNDATIYYRLKTNNKDGSYNTSTIIANPSCNSKEEYNALSAFYYENNLSVLSQFAADAKVVYILFDLQGKKVASGEYFASKGNQVATIPVADLADGIYIFNAESNAAFYNRKIIIAK